MEKLSLDEIIELAKEKIKDANLEDLENFEGKLDVLLKDLGEKLGNQE